MPKDKPEATSTPTAVPLIQGRKPIRDNNSVQSPILLDDSGQCYRSIAYERSSSRSPQASPVRRRRGHVSGSGNDDTDDSDPYSEDEGKYSDKDEHFKRDIQSNQQKSENNKFSYILIGFLVIIFLPLVALYFTNDNDTSAKTTPSDLNTIFKSLENDFSTQVEDFWRNIKVSIKEIPILDRPRTIIFLYEKKAENTLNKILRKVSEIALCNLSECSNKAVIIEGPSLNKSEIINDYGKIIVKYRHNLEDSGVMIVRNLETVPGKSAQAFHSFCDEYNPIVRKALILFTFKVNKIPKTYLTKFLEDYLLKLWNDIGKDDKFYPLFTRISDTVLPVKPE